MLSQLPEFPVYPLLPVDIVSGKGCYVYDAEGNEYLDMYGGHAVASTGHCHPRVVEALTRQAQTLFFYSNVTSHPTRTAFCQKLIGMAPDSMSGVFLCNSGAEANENALTVARFATRRPVVVSVEGGFHGRTLLNLSICGIEKYRRFAAIDNGPLFAYRRVIPFNDCQAAVESISDTCGAVIVEPIQGLAGCRDCSKEFLGTLRECCDRVGALLIFDEVQCGTGRSGAFTAGQLFGITPDIITLAKGLGSGFPLGAVLANENALAAVSSGNLGSTFGGGPLACAAGLATLECLTAEEMIANAGRVGGHLKERMLQVPGVLSVQGAGLLLGAVLDRKAADVRDRLLTDRKIMVGTSVPANVLRLMPPLNLSINQADHFIAALVDVLSKGNK